MDDDDLADTTVRDVLADLARLRPLSSTAIVGQSSIFFANLMICIAPKTVGSFKIFRDQLGSLGPNLILLDQICPGFHKRARHYYVQAGSEGSI